MRLKFDFAVAMLRDFDELQTVKRSNGINHTPIL